MVTLMRARRRDFGRVSRLFSRRERDFLVALVRSKATRDASQRYLIRSFPNPIYRRKMLWGIRRKARQAAADWELYLRAATVECKVLPAAVDSEPPPLASEPLVSLVHGVRSLLGAPLRSQEARRNDRNREADRK